MDVTKKHKKVKRTKEHNSNTVLSKGKLKSDGVGQEYVIGDMVWGKVESYPWWPGYVSEESKAPVSVQEDKLQGHILVAFYGDGTYKWFKTTELIPFEENFNEKSRQDSSKEFVRAVKEAVEEVSRMMMKRMSAGLACKCRNLFYSWPSGVDGHVVVDFDDDEPVSYSLRQVKEARNSFQPEETVSFIRQLALAPMDDQQHKTIQFIKKKATALACRKALYEEFDETYAQAFGKVAIRPSRPTAPIIADPSKAPLSGTLVTTETLGKDKACTSPSKTKEQLEKEVQEFKWRDGSRLSGRVSGQAHTAYEGGVSDYKKQGTSRHRPEGGKKIAKTQRLVGELSSKNAGLVEKKNKEKMKREISANLVQAAVSGHSSAIVKTVEGGKKRNPSDDIEGHKTKRLVGELSSENAGLVEKKNMKREISANLVQAAVSGNSSAKVESVLRNTAHVKTRQEVKTAEGGKKRNPPDNIEGHKKKKKALYEEFDETYAQAFGQVPIRPSRPTAPFIVNPSKAPLSSTQVTSETLGKDKACTTPSKTKEQLEKEVLEYKWRDGSRLSGRVSGQAHMAYEGGVSDYKKQSTSRHPPEDGKKKAKTKRLVGELSSENAGLVEKKNKEKMKREISANLVQAAVSGNSSAKVKTVEGGKKRNPLDDIEGHKTKRLVGELGSKNAGLVEKKKMKREISADLVQAAVSGNSSAKVESVLRNPAHVKARQEVKTVGGGKKCNPSEKMVNKKEMETKKQQDSGH